MALAGRSAAPGVQTPAQLWPEAKSVIMLAENPMPLSDRSNDGDRRKPDRGAISVYAREIKIIMILVKKRLKRLGALAPNRREAGGEVKVFVDTAPVPEKPLGPSCRIGLAGQAHQFGQPVTLGNWFFYRIDLHHFGVAGWMTADTDHCGSCSGVFDRPVRQHAFPKRHINSMRGAAFPI